jgi:hypothetical protein
MPDTTDACGIHGDVQSTETGDGLGGGGVDRLLRRDVADYADRVLTEVAGGSIDNVSTPAGERDASSSLDDGASAGKSDARAPAGHESNLLTQVNHRRCLPKATDK